MIYAGEMVWLALNASRDELLTDKLVLQRIALFGPLIFAGLWAATLSSALASLLFNVVGASLFDKHPLRLIQVYLTFPLGEKALGDDFSGFALGGGGLTRSC